MHRLIAFTALAFTTLVALITAVACDDTPDDVSPAVSDDEAPKASSASDDIRDACYHFELDGPVEDSATCLSHSTHKGDDGSLTVELTGPDTILTLKMPRDLTVEQYPIAATVGQQVASATATHSGDALPAYTADDGTLTVMRVDDDAISALFDFEATSDDGEADALSVRGHLRDLERAP